MDPMDLVNASGRGKWNVFAWLQVSPIEGVVVVFCKFQHPFQRVHILDDLEINTPLSNAIQVMYENTSALVMTPEGNTDVFTIDTGVLQGDPLAPFLFIIYLHRKKSENFTPDYTVIFHFSPCNLTSGVRIFRKYRMKHFAR